MLIDKLKTESEVNNNERDAFKTKSQVQIDDLHKQLHTITNELKAKNELIKEQENKIESMNKQNTNEIQMLHNKNTQLISKYNKEIKELSEQKEALISKHREEIDRITFQHTIQVNEIQLKLDSQISELKLDNIHLNERIDMYDHKINACVVMFDDVVSSVNELSDSLLIKDNNNNNNNEDDSNNNSINDNITKIKSGILTKLIAIQNKNSTFKHELRNIITKQPNDNSLNSTMIASVSKNSVKKLLASTSVINNRYISTMSKRGTIKSNSNNSTGRTSIMKKSVSQKLIITANNKK